MSDPAAPGPDFLCIGMGKSGTGWLYDQLQFHSDFWMPPIKELHYLDREFPQLRSSRHKRPRSTNRGERVEGQSRAERKAMRKEIDPRDIAFINEARANANKPRDLDFYARWFRYKGDKLSGDISPSYCQMEEEMIRTVMARFPGIKIIFMIRDPVSRAWSHFSMKSRGYRVDKQVLLNPETFREHLKDSKVTGMGIPATLTKRWLAIVPKEQFRYYFFDDLSAEPDKVRGDMLRFLGANPDAKAAALEADFNRKAEKPKLTLSDENRAILIDHFRGELKACADLFGGPALKWAAKYGVAV